jgi:hypothetical protein
MKMAANPVDYVGKSLQGKHIVLLHEDPRYAQLLELSYLHNGLEQKRVCVYLTYRRITLAESQMKKRGLDTEQYKGKQLLHIARIQDSSFDFFNTVKQLYDKTEGAHNFHRCRIVWLFDKERYDEKQLSFHIEKDAQVQTALERKGFSNNTNGIYEDIFRDFNGSILCSYPINKKSLGHPWIIRHHLNNHDSVILAPKHGRGVVLQSNGLKISDMEAWIQNKLET